MSPEQRKVFIQQLDAAKRELIGGTSFKPRIVEQNLPDVPPSSFGSLFDVIEADHCRTGERMGNAYRIINRIMSELEQEQRQYENVWFRRIWKALFKSKQ